MARDFNENRNVNAKLVSANINTMGVTFAAQKPYRADGFLKVNVSVENANPTQKDFLEGNNEITAYALGQNINKLSAYSLYGFPNIETLYLFSTTLVDIVETENNEYLDYLLSLEDIYVPGALLSLYQNAYANLSSKFVEINEDYVLTITGSGTLIEEEITNQLMNGTYNAQDRNSCSKLVISGYDNYMSAIWSYDFSEVLPNLDNNIWFNKTKLDFTTRELSGVDELLESDITNLISGISIDKINGVIQLKFSGFSDMSVALTYDYSALPNLEYVWLDNVRYEKERYVEVEYIKGTGTQWINTGVYGTLNTKVELELAFTTSSLGQSIFGSRQSATNNNLTIFNFSSNDLYIDYINYALNRFTITSGIGTTKHKIVISKDVISFDNTQYTPVTTQELNTPTPLYLFDIGNNQTQSNKALMSSYTLKISESNVVVRDFVGSYRASDNEVGLYDKENKIFYQNQGTGVFEKGNDTGNVYLGDSFEIATYFYPLSNLETEYDARLTQTFYLDYNGTLPSYPNYQLTYYTDINCTTSILPADLVSGTRYYAKAVMVTLTIQGSGTLTSAIVEPQVAKAGSGVTKVIVPVDFTSYDNYCLDVADTSLPNLEHIEVIHSTTSSYQVKNLMTSLTSDSGKVKTFTDNFTGLLTAFSFQDTKSLLNVYVKGNGICGENYAVSYYSNSNIENIHYEEGITKLSGYGQFSGNSIYKTIDIPTTCDGFQVALLGYSLTSGTMKMYIRSSSLNFDIAAGSIQSATSKFYFPTQTLATYMTKTGWSSRTSQLIGFLDYTGTIPAFSGYADTWYSDEDCTTPIATTDFVSGNRYFVKLTAI